MIRSRIRDLARLRQRITDLEAEVQECRQLNLRLAEVTDLVSELLVTLADTDDPRVAAAVARYRAGVSTRATGADGSR
jgi:alkylation response protein AidB-like acyl-CoA dehydrogenase